MARRDELIALLQEILREGTGRRERIERFQQEVWQGPSDPAQEPLPASLADLAYDLDFYEGDPGARREDPAYFGDDRLVAEVAATLRGLGVEPGRGAG